MIAPTFADVLFADANMSISGVPESRSGAASGWERNTSRFVCDPVGFEIIVFSDWPELSVRSRFGSGEPTLTPIDPAVVAVRPLFRKTFTGFVPGSGQSGWSS